MVLLQEETVEESSSISALPLVPVLLITATLATATVTTIMECLVQRMPGAKAGGHILLLTIVQFTVNKLFKHSQLSYFSGD